MFRTSQIPKPTSDARKDVTQSPIAPTVFTQLRDRVREKLLRAIETGTSVLCTTCQRQLPGQAFYLNRGISTCRSCYAARRKRRRLRTPLAAVLNQAERVAKRDRHAYSLSPAWIDQVWVLQQGRCVLTGLRLELYRSSRDPAQATVLRFDPSRGFDLTNCGLACRAVARFQEGLQPAQARAWWDLVMGALPLGQWQHDPVHGALVAELKAALKDPTKTIAYQVPGQQVEWGDI
jgi:hypothetical protein